jgi:D-alanyl-D-alanine carboxypeptidase
MGTDAGKPPRFRRLALGAIFMAAAAGLTAAAPADALARSRHHVTRHHAPARHHRRPARAPGIEGPRYGAIVIDAATGQVLYENGADKKLHPASMTKIMTLLLVFDALKDKRLTLDQEITISPHANSMPPTKLGLGAGAKIRVEDAILALVTESANDIASALGEALGGTEENFARLMTQRAAGLGMADTTFRNASGLPDPDNISTARDMAKLAAYVIETYPTYYKYFSTRSFTYKGRAHRNHNNLMRRFPGMDGIKTGFINASGFNLAASAVRGSDRVIAIVFGGPNARIRDNKAEELLNLGFRELHRLHSLPPKKPDTPKPS